VFDFATNYPGYFIKALTFDEDGFMYLGTDATEGIIIVEPNGTFYPLYPGVLEGEIYAMTWGNREYLYATRKSSEDEKKRILRINMRKKGAPYFGRE